MKKKSIIQVIKDLPQEVDLNELFEMILVREKIEMGLEEIESGQTVSHKKVVKYFQRKFANK